MAKIICIANRKGGVGKTTIATNLLIGFQQKGKTILIDTDEQQSSMRWSKQRNDINSEYIGSDLMCAELAGDFHLGDSRQLTDKSLLPFDLVS